MTLTPCEVCDCIPGEIPNDTFKQNVVVALCGVIDAVEASGGGSTPLTYSAPIAATVGVGAAQALAANANRKGLILVNTSSNNISISIGGTAVLYSGITLNPFGTFQMDATTFATGAVSAIASAASSNLAIQEIV